MEKETKRILQLVLETMKDQHNAIRALEHEVWGSSRTFSDGIADRIERIAKQVRDSERFTAEIS
jgi:uncharacterized protein Yka (UPF0111/DUF47 family)